MTGNIPCGKIIQKKKKKFQNGQMELDVAPEEKLHILFHHVRISHFNTGEGKFSDAFVREGVSSFLTQVHT